MNRGTLNAITVISTIVDMRVIKTQDIFELSKQCLPQVLNSCQYNERSK